MKQYLVQIIIELLKRGLDKLKNKPKLLVKKLDPNAKLPLQTAGNAGYDLYALESVVIPPGERKLIRTGISIRPPDGWYGHICDRSSVALKFGGHCIGKIVDNSWSGDYSVLMLNTDRHKELAINIGDRPAQVIFKRYGYFEITEVDDLPSSDRGDRGWGSSGR